jgi:hypothetical protein
VLREWKKNKFSNNIYKQSYKIVCISNLNASYEELKCMLYKLYNFIDLLQILELKYKIIAHDIKIWNSIWRSINYISARYSTKASLDRAKKSTKVSSCRLKTCPIYRTKMLKFKVWKYLDRPVDPYSLVMRSVVKNHHFNKYVLKLMDFINALPSLHCYE